MGKTLRTAAFFDLDKTIIATSSTIAFSHELHVEGLLTRVDTLRTAYAQFLFMIGGADARQTSRLRDAIAETITGWEAAKVQRIVEETVDQLIDPVVYEEALRLILRHKANGRDVVIVSASGAEIVRPIARLLGATSFIASKMEVVDGKYTGEIGFYAFGPQKAKAIRRLAEESGYDLKRCYAYSDSITDAPMLNAVGFGYAVNPDRAMKRAATEKGWGLLEFEKPVILRKATNRRLAVIAGVAVAVIGLAWIGMSRRRTRWS
ncbi:MAG: HAD-IB family hydrolase [Demequinaceae bacterium]|nr:HAD-IB family hydrolase [Demequinaceae bacterium]